MKRVLNKTVAAFLCIGLIICNLPVDVMAASLDDTSEIKDMLLEQGHNSPIEVDNVNDMKNSFALGPIKREDTPLQNSEAGSVVDQGNCGNLQWKYSVAIESGLDPKGTLVISGSGRMINFNSGVGGESETQPWRSYLSSINHVIIEEGVESIGVAAFKDCVNLETVSLPDGLISLGSHCFYGCKSLESISIPETVNFIDKSVFEKCENLKIIDFPPEISSIEQSVCSGCNSLCSVSLPSDLTRIDMYAFANSSMRGIVIPLSLNYIGNYAFNGCRSLRNVYYEGSKDDWNKVNIGSNNGALTNARIHYNYNGGPVETSVTFNNKDLVLKNWNLDDLVTSKTTMKFDNAIAGLALSRASYSSKTEVDKTLLDLGLVDEVNDGKWRWHYAYDNNGVAHTFALREYNGYNFITAVVRGSTNGEDWATVNMFPLGFQRTAGEILGDLETFLSDRSIDKNDDKNVFFISGHSMGGSVAGDMAKIIETTWSTQASQINCYTYAAPFNVWDWIDYSVNDNPWYFIHNVVNSTDPAAYYYQGGTFPIRWGCDRVYCSANNNSFEEWYRYLCGCNFSATKPDDNHPTEVYMALLLSESSIRRINSRLVAIRCPIDVSVINKDGVEVAKIKDNTLTKCTDSNVLVSIVGDEKFVSFSTEDNYKLNLTATDNGEMKYEVADIVVPESGETNNLTVKSFENIALTNGKKMQSKMQTSGDIPNTRLLVLGDNSNPVKEINEDGTEKEYSDSISGDRTINSNIKTSELAEMGSSNVLTVQGNVTLTIDSSLTIKRVLLDNANLTIMDGGNNGKLTIACDDDDPITVSANGCRFTLSSGSVEIKSKPYRYGGEYDIPNYAKVGSLYVRGGAIKSNVPLVTEDAHVIDGNVNAAIAGNSAVCGGEITNDYIIISGGTVKIDCNDDAISSVCGTISISGGSVDVRGGGSGIGAGEIYITGGQVKTYGGMYGLSASKISVSGESTVVDASSGMGGRNGGAIYFGVYEPESYGLNIAAPLSITTPANAIIKQAGEGNAYGYVYDGNTAANHVIIQNLENPDPSGGFIVEGLEDGYAYIDSQITPSIRVYDGSKQLIEKRDYTLSYKNNTKVYTIAEGEPDFDPKKAPAITVTSKGNYDSTDVVYFKILPQNIGGEDFSADDITLPISTKPQKIKPVLYWNGKALKQKTDYTCAVYKASDTEFKNPLGLTVTSDEPCIVRFTGTGNFTGTRDISLTFTKDQKLVSSLKIDKVPAVVYTGTPITPEPIVRDGSTVLVRGVHYSVTYASNVNPGTGYVIITGAPENGYSGTKRVPFKINAQKGSKAGAYDISPDKDTANRIQVECASTVDYVKGGAKPAVTVKFTDDNNNIRTLTEGIDYRLSYKSNTAVTTNASVVVTGKGAFKGSRSQGFAINAKDISKVSAYAEDKVYQNKANIYATRITLTDSDGKKLSVKKDYQVDKYTYLNDTEVTVGGNKEIRKAGTEIGKQDILPVDTVIEVTLLAVNGSGYTGTVKSTYRISKASISSAKVTIPTQTYTGKPIEFDPATITVSVKGQKLTTSDFEIVGYENNVNKGTAKVTIRGKGNYGGYKKQSFKIKAKAFRWWWHNNN